MAKKQLTSLDLRGDILINGTANSNNGWVLTSNGVGAVSWAAASGSGSLGYIGTTQSTASSGGTTALNGIRTMTPDASFTLSPSSVSTATGRSITFTGGSSTNASGTGGDVVIYGGTSNSSAAGVAGNVVLNAGAGGADNGNGFVKIGESNTELVVVTPGLQIKNNLKVGTTGGFGSAGTSGQVLTSTGTGSPPTWTDKGGYTLITSTLFSSAVSFTNIPQTYKAIMVRIVFTNLNSMAASQFGVSFNGSTYGGTYFRPSVSSTFTTLSNANRTPLTSANTAPVVGNSYVVEITNYTVPNSTARLYGDVVSWSGTIAAAVTSLAFANSSWGGATGTAELYGVN